MTTYEFLTQSPKEIGKALKAAGIEKYGAIPEDVKKLAKVLNLEPDSRVDYYSTITRGGGTEWYIHFKSDFGFGKKDFEIEYYVKGKVSITYGRIGGFHTSVKIYEKICPLFDDRKEYHNLEFSIEGKEYTPYAKSTYPNERDYPVFDDNKPLSEYIQIITDLAAGYKPYIEIIEKLCFNGEYEKGYNLYHFNPFVVGHMIITEDPGFTGCVHAMYNAQERLNTKLDIAQIQGLYRYLWLHINEYRDYNNDEEKVVEKPLAAYVSELFHEKLSEELTPDLLMNLLVLADKEGLVDKKKESWDSVHLAANREFHFAVEKLEKELAEKYDIPQDYIGIFNYDEDTDSCQTVDCPPELKNRFS